MLATEAVTDGTARRVTGLLTAELDQAVERKEFGVIVRDIVPLDLPDLTEVIAQPRFVRSKRLRVALVAAR